MSNTYIISAKWWRVGSVRILSICGMVMGMRGTMYNIQHGGILDWSRFSGPSSLLALITCISLFILGFRTDISMRDHEKLSRIPNS